VNNRNVHIFLGNGDTTFRPEYVLDTAGQTECITITDVNGDNRPDMVVGGVYPHIAVLLGKGDGSFLPRRIYPAAGIRPLSLAIADVNRDGKPDLAVANDESKSVSILLNRGDGTFTPEWACPDTHSCAVVAFGIDANPFSIGAADFNRDGKPDLAVMSSAGAVAGLFNTSP
jgi:hypothetical protein